VVGGRLAGGVFWHDKGKGRGRVDGCVERLERKEVGHNHGGQVGSNCYELKVGEGLVFENKVNFYNKLLILVKNSS